MAQHYNAFISYRHHPLDIQVATDIHRSLERYKLPKSLKQKTKGITRLFRDKDELPITSNLTSDITAALENSDYLIVICSTHTNESIWVQREIETFLKTHDRSKVLTVLADGEPQNTIPQILQQEEVFDPVTGEKTIIPVEPLSCDWRMSRKKAHREELPRLAAALLGCGYDELRQRLHQYRTRRMIALLSGGMAAMLALSAYFIATSIKISNQNAQLQSANQQILEQNNKLEDANEQIQNNLTEALQNQSQFLASAAFSLLDEGDRLTAIHLALAALPSEEDSRPYVPEAERALSSAVGLYMATPEVSAVGSIAANALISDFKLNEDGSLIYVLDESMQITIWDTKTFQKLYTIYVGEYLKSMEILPSGNILLGGYGKLWCVQPSGEPVWSINNYEYERHVLTGDQVLVFYRHYVSSSYTGILQFLNAETGAEIRAALDLPQTEDGFYPVKLETPATDGHSPILVTYSSNADLRKHCMVNPLTGQVTELLVTENYLRCTAYTSDGNILIMVPDGSGMNNGYWGSYLSSSPALAHIHCFDSVDGTLLWTSQIVSYQYGSETMASIPGSNKILVQKDCTFQVHDVSTGEILAVCESLSQPIDVNVEEDNTWGILSDGSYFVYSYDDNTCQSMVCLVENLTMGDVNKGYFAVQALGSEVIVYRSMSDESWDRFSGDYLKNLYSYKSLHTDTHLAVLHSSDVYMFDLESGQFLWSIPLDFTSRVLGFSQDGKTLWATKQRESIVDGDRLIYAIDVITGDKTDFRVYDSDDLKYASFYESVIHEDQIYFLASAADQDTLFIRNLTNDSIKAIPISGKYEANAVYAVFGSWVLMDDHDENLFLFNADSAKYVSVADSKNDQLCFTTDPGQGIIAFGLGNEVHLYNEDGERTKKFALETSETVSLSIYKDQVLVLCKDGALYRYSMDGKLQSKIGLFLYNTFYTVTRSIVDDGAITWDYTDDGDLILKVYNAGNIIDTTHWHRRAHVPNCITYLSEFDTFVTSRTKLEGGIGRFLRKSTANVIQIAKEQLGSHQLTDEQKASYGLN